MNDSDSNTKFVPKMAKTAENIRSNLASMLSGASTCLPVWYLDKGRESVAVSSSLLLK